MRDLLPDAIIEVLSDRYIAGVANAEAFFDEHRADEDSVTGALGQALAMRSPLEFVSDGARYSVMVNYRKLRGRGPGAPERRYGSDGLFQMSVVDATGMRIRTKGLPFQSKMNWKGKNAGLALQALKMQSETGDGIVIDYRSSGYKACMARVVVDAKGDRKLIDLQNDMRPLDQILGKDFLNCNVGVIGLFFDPEQEKFVVHHPQTNLRHLVTTSVVVTNESSK